MRRLSLRLIVALLTFCVGVTAASLWFILRRPSAERVKVGVIEPLQTPAKPERTYGPGGSAGSCVTKDRFPCSFTDFESSDGMTFTQMSEFYNSPRRANRELQGRLKKATEIVKREPIFDERGKRKGEKVIATFPPDDPYSGAAEILWTDGSRF